MTAMTVVLPFDPQDCDLSYSQTGWSCEVRDVDGAFLYCSGCIDGWGDEKLKPLRFVGVAGPPGSWQGSCDQCGKQLTKEILLVIASWPTLSEVVLYEAWMFVETANKLAINDFPDQVTANATIESFAVHVRQILDFLFATQMDWKKRDGDLTADLFFDNPLEWNATPSELLKQTKKRVGTLVAHMTRTRAGREAKEKSWGFKEILAEVVEHLLAFANAAGNKHLATETKEYLRSLKS